MEKNEDYKKIYFENTISDRTRGASNRITFLGFLITINGAIIYTIYNKDNSLNDILCISPILFLKWFLLIINFIISLIYFREHYISKIYTDAANSLLKAGFVENFINEISNRDIKNVGATWFCVRLLLSFLICPS